MRLKGHDNRRSTDGIGLFNGFMKKGLVSYVDAIKIADGDDGIFIGLFNIIYIFN
jgi:hypothetical protein